MRVLITGAAGFLGREYVRHHLSREDTVLGVDDLSSPYAYWPDELPMVSRVQRDVQAYLSDADIVDFDLAYHFAAPVGGREKIDGDPMYNADSLRLDSLFFRWALGRVRTVVYPSSSAVYGTNFQNGGSGPLSESFFNPITMTWHRPDQMYGFTKMAGEVLAWKSADYGLDVLCLRPFSGYGEEQSLEYPVPSIAARVARREDPLVIWGSGVQKRDFIHVSDLVGATQARLDLGVHGYHALNIGSGVGTTFTEVAGMLAEIVGYSPKIVTDPSKPEGVKSRWADATRMNQFYTPKVTLTEGLTRVLRAQEESLVRQA